MAASVFSEDIRDESALSGRLGIRRHVFSGVLSRAEVTLPFHAAHLAAGQGHCFKHAFVPKCGLLVFLFGNTCSFGIGRSWARPVLNLHKPHASGDKSPAFPLGVWGKIVSKLYTVFAVFFALRDPTNGPFDLMGTRVVRSGKAWRISRPKASLRGVRSAPPRRKRPGSQAPARDRPR